MSNDVSVNGKPWKVAIEPVPGQNGRHTVIVNGRTREVDAVWIDTETLSLIDSATGAAHEIRLTRRGDAVDVAVNGRVFRTVVEKRGSFAHGSRKTTPVPFSDDGRVVAPMPGRVVRLLVAAGDTVTARQPVVVVEAMKMENELRAPKDGVVAEVLTQEGSAIETGAVLLVVH